MALLGLGVLLSAITLAAVVAGAEPQGAHALGPGYDARAYWLAARTEPYGGEVGAFGAYLYSPAFLQATAPLTSLTWDAFLGVWTGLAMVVLAGLAGPLLFAPLLLFAFFEIWGGNIHLLLAAAIVVGFRWPAAWSLVLLTKMTPGIGLLWFAARREWRSLAVAFAATAGIVVVSWLYEPRLWAEWIEMLSLNTQARPAAVIGSETGSVTPGSVPIPLIARLPLAALLVVYAARRDEKWLVPVAAMLALPVLWWGGLSMLVGSVALRRQAIEQALSDVLERLRVRGESNVTRTAAS
jgi:hypothetical protein